MSALCKSKFAARRDLRVDWSELERAYHALAVETARLTTGRDNASAGTVRAMLREWRMRASARNPSVHVTGDGILAVMEELLKLPRSEAQPVIAEVISKFEKTREAKPNQVVERAIRQLEKYGEGI